MKYFFLSLTLVLTTADNSYSQTATFSGRVTDQNTGVGMPNVAVVVLGNQTGTRVAITDTQGNYATSIGGNTHIKLRAYRTNFVFNPLANDKRTRVKLLLVDLDLLSGETLSVITAQGVDQSQVSHNLPVEDLRKVPGSPWLSQLTVMLPSDLPPGVLTVSVTARGKTSNSATIRVQ